VFYRVLERAFSFVRCAGTIILAVSVLVWAALYYPHNTEQVEAPFRPQLHEIEARLATLPPGDPERTNLLNQQDHLQREIAGAYQRQSLLGRFGRAIEPVFRPLGWDWRIGSAVLASFPAREVVVATMSVIFDLGEDVDPEADEGFSQMDQKLHSATWEGTDRALFNIPVALSIMVFFALCAQCAATLAVIRRETNSWRWPLFTFTYMTLLAYVGAMLTYQLGMWILG
jgi:ferrous iron transport protein B